MASPSVTCVRQEESNYWILALRSACLHKSPSCFPVFSSSVACSCNYRRSETWKTLLKPKIIVGCQTTEATHLEEFCKKKVMFGPFVLQGRCQVYKSEFEYRATSSFSLLNVLCLLQIFKCFSFISQTKPASFNNVNLTSWKYLFKHGVIFLEDMRATLHRYC